jgi:hypothetical protein
MSETPTHRHRPLLPVALVVRLPRRHETPSLVSQVVPTVGEGSEQIAATGTALVEWAGGAVTFTRDVEGLDLEEQARRQHFIQLCDAAASEGFSAGDVRHSRFLPRCGAHSRGPQGAALTPLSVQAISQNQLKRLRNWTSNQGLRFGPRAERLCLSHTTIGATAVVSALERSPWTHNRTSMLTAAQSAPGANVRERATASGNAPTLVVEVQRANAPHDTRQVPLNVLARSLDAECRSNAAADALRQAAMESVRRCLNELLLSRLLVAAELRVLGVAADGDSSARITFRRLFVWYESFAFPEPLALECLRSAAEEDCEPVWSEAGALAALAGDPEPLQRAFSDPSGLPHVRETSVIGTTANQRTGAAHRSSARAAALSEVLTVSLRLKRTPFAYELVRRR